MVEFQKLDSGVCSCFLSARRRLALDRIPSVKQFALDIRIAAEYGRAKLILKLDILMNFSFVSTLLSVYLAPVLDRLVLSNYYLDIPIRPLQAAD
jgi:hypothetical protein